MVSEQGSPIRQINPFAFVKNRSVSLVDSVGLVTAQSVPSGKVCCGKGCVIGITGCDKWPSSTKQCCIDHESIHQKQLGTSKSTFCNISKDKNGKDCCLDEGRCSNVNDYPGMSQNDIECPAYKNSLDCCRKQWNKSGLTEQEACDIWSCMFSAYLYRKGGVNRKACPGAESDDLPPKPDTCDLPTGT